MRRFHNGRRIHETTLDGSLRWPRRRSLPLGRRRRRRPPAPRRSPTKGAQKVRRCARAATASSAGAPRSRRCTACRSSSGQNAAVHRRWRSGIQERRSQPSVDAGDRRVAHRPGHGRHRGVLRASAAHDGGQMMMSMRRFAVAALAVVALRVPRTAHAPPTSRPARRRRRKSARPATASTATRRPRPTIRSSPASIPTTSRRRCATTSPARARTRSWPGFAQRADGEGHREPRRVFYVAAAAVSRRATERRSSRTRKAPRRRPLPLPLAGTRDRACASGARAVPLRLPHHFAQAFEHRVQRRVLVAARRAHALELRADAGRLVDRELLRDREVQRQVQERIDVARLRAVVAVADASPAASSSA